MNRLFGCDQELMYELQKLEELDSLYGLSKYPESNSNNDSNMALYKEKSATGHASFDQLPIMHWGPQNCMEWGSHICQKYNICTFHIDISTFNKLNGPQLMQSTENDFCSLLGDQYGFIFFKELQKLRKNMFTEVQRRHSNSDDYAGIDQSQYTVNLNPCMMNMDSYSSENEDKNKGIAQSHYSVNLNQNILSMDSYSTTYRSLNKVNNKEIDQSQNIVNLNPCIQSMDSYCTASRSSNGDKNQMTVQSQYTVNSDLCIPSMESYSSLNSDNNKWTNQSLYIVNSDPYIPNMDSYSSPNGDKSKVINKNQYTVNSHPYIPSMDSYSSSNVDKNKRTDQSQYIRSMDSYASLNGDKNKVIDQNQYRVNSHPYIPSILSMNSNSTNYRPLNINKNKMIDQSQYTSNLDPYIPSMDTNYTPFSYPQDLQDSNTSKFHLLGNLEYFEAESKVIIDSYDATWDIPEESWENVDVTDLNSDLNLDAFSLESAVMLDSSTKVQRKTADRQTKQISNQKFNFSAGCVEDIIKKMPGIANRDRCPRSWEFLMRLLVNTETNPSLIRWEDESQYVFRLVKPDLIIQIWNAKSEKSSPNKDNFARSLRYHYKKGILLPVPEKQLVYSCGPKAIDYVNNLRKL